MEQVSVVFTHCKNVTSSFNETVDTLCKQKEEILERMSRIVCRKSHILEVVGKMLTPNDTSEMLDF